MAPLTYKPRPKMHSWTPSGPPKPKPSRFYLWAVFGWLGVVTASYAWFERGDPLGSGDDEASEIFDAFEPSNSVRIAPPKDTTSEVSIAGPSPVPTSPLAVANDSARMGGEARMGQAHTGQAHTGQAHTGEARTGAEGGPRESSAEPGIVDCEHFLKEAAEAAEGRLPAHLGRSALDAFVGENEWAKPCRRRERRTLDLCVAVRDGRVVGLSVKTSPPNLALESCLREEAAKLSLPPEASVRVVRTKLRL